MRNRMCAKSGRLVLVGLVWLLASTGAWAEAPTSQPACDAAGYGTAVGRARYVPAGYKAPRERVQFVIFGDRAGGEQPGFMRQGIELVNLLRPEFVVSIGDMIEGNIKAGKGVSATRAATQINEQWIEFEEIISWLHVPFFHVPGNHDIWDSQSSLVFTNVFGARYYSFDAKGVHVVVLNSEEWREVGGKVMLGETQIAWLKDDLDKHADAPLTVVIVHHPVWRNTERGDWSAVEAMLAGHNAIVFAGHEHGYSYEMRGDIPYVIVGPVAGVQGATNQSLGWFRHVTLVTVEDGRPHVALVKLDGAVAMDAVSRQARDDVTDVQETSRLTYSPAQPEVGKPVSIVWAVCNPSDTAVKIDVAWSRNSPWRVEPDTASVLLQPKQTHQMEFQGVLWLAGRTAEPTMTAAFSWPDRSSGSLQTDWVAQPARVFEAGHLTNVQARGPAEAAWSLLPGAAVTDMLQIVKGLEYWSDTRDLGATVKASLSGTELCILAQVTDDDVQSGSDELEIAFADVPAGQPVDAKSQSFYKVRIIAPDQQGLQTIRWDSPGRIDYAAAGLRTESGWIVKVVFDIAPLVEDVTGEMRMPFNYLIKDGDKNQPGRTCVTWVGTQDTLDGLGEAGVLVIPARLAQPAGEIARKIKEEALKAAEE